MLTAPVGNTFTLSGDRVITRSGKSITVNPNFTSSGAGTWKAVAVSGGGLRYDPFSFSVH